MFNLFEVIITIPIWVIPKRRRKHVKANRQAYIPAYGGVEKETIALTGNENSVEGPVGQKSNTGFVSKAANAVVRRFGSIYPANGTSAEDDEEYDDDDEDDENGRDDLGNSEFKNTGQILWIRGLSRLQTQVKFDSLLKILFLIKN